MHVDKETHYVSFYFLPSFLPFFPCSFTHNCLQITIVFYHLGGISIIFRLKLFSGKCSGLFILKNDWFNQRYESFFYLSMESKNLTALMLSLQNRSRNTYASAKDIPSVLLSFCWSSLNGTAQVQILRIHSCEKLTVNFIISEGTRPEIGYSNLGLLQRIHLGLASESPWSTKPSSLKLAEGLYCHPKGSKVDLFHLCICAHFYSECDRVKWGKLRSFTSSMTWCGF